MIPAKSRRLLTQTEDNHGHLHGFDRDNHPGSRCPERDQLPGDIRTNLHGDPQPCILDKQQQVTLDADLRDVYHADLQLHFG